MGLVIMQIDVETAFLNGKINSKVYIKQPKGFEDGTSRVCKLIKALYGLKESSRAWYECLAKFLISVGFKNSEIDYCLFYLKLKDEFVYLLIYVDDLLICGKNISLINKIKSLLSKRFKMKDMSEIKQYLGITVNVEYCKNIIKLSQTKYIES